MQPLDIDNFRLDYSFTESSESSDLMNRAVGRVSSIIDEQITNQQKIDLIKIFFSEFIEESFLQSICIQELEVQNDLLLKFNDKLILKQNELSKKLQELSNQVILILQKDGMLQKETDELRLSLEKTTSEKLEFLKERENLKKENSILESTVVCLTNKQKIALEELNEKEREVFLLSERLNARIVEKEDLKQKLDVCKRRCQIIEEAADKQEFEQKKKDYLNSYDKTDVLLYGSCFLIVGALTGGLGLAVAAPTIYFSDRYLKKLQLEKLLGNSKGSLIIPRDLSKPR